MLLLTQPVFAASFVVFLGACGSSASRLATAVVLVGTIVYTLGELIGGPVLRRTAAEAAPDHLRGRYLSMIQLAWNLRSTVAPVLLRLAARPRPEPRLARDAGARGRGPRLARWRGSARCCPQAAERVTNHAAEGTRPTHRA